MAISFKVNGGPVSVDAPKDTPLLWVIREQLKLMSRSELAMPPAVTAEMAKGFTLYMVKAVMSSRGDEWLDLARTNLWR
jgi:hypothetical protein